MFPTFLDLTPLEFPKAVHCGSNMPPTNPYADTLFLTGFGHGAFGRQVVPERMVILSQEEM